MNATRIRQRMANLDIGLDAILAERWAPASWERVEDMEELPWKLRQLVVTLPRDAWRAYADGACFALAAGVCVGPRDIAVSFYDASAKLCAAGVWSTDSRGHWQLTEIVESLPRAASGASSGHQPHT